MVAGADLLVYNDEKFCVLIFCQVASIFHLRVGGWGNKIIWANLLTTMIYQGGFTIEGNSPLFGNVVTTFWGVDGRSKIFRSHFQYNSACEPFVRSTFFCQGQNPAPFLAMQVFSFPSLPVNSSLWSCSLRLGFGMELCLGPFQTVSYVLEYIQEYWGKVHKSIDLFYSPLICNGIFTFSILKTLLFGTEKK